MKSTFMAFFNHVEPTKFITKSSLLKENCVRNISKCPMPTSPTGINLGTEYREKQHAFSIYDTTYRFIIDCYHRGFVGYFNHTTIVSLWVESTDFPKNLYIKYKRPGPVVRIVIVYGRIYTNSREYQELCSWRTQGSGV